MTAHVAYATGTIYGGGSNGNADAMNAATGVVQWTKHVGSSVFGLALCGGSVWVSNGNLHRLDPASGAEIGRFDPSTADTFGTDVVRRHRSGMYALIQLSPVATTGVSPSLVSRSI